MNPCLACGEWTDSPNAICSRICWQEVHNEPEPQSEDRNPTGPEDSYDEEESEDDPW